MTYTIVNTSYGSGMTDMIQSHSTFGKKEKKEMRLIFISWIYTMYLYFEHYFWKYDTSVSVYYLLFHIYDAVNTSDGSGMTDMIESTYQMEVEWHMIQSTYQNDVLTIVYVIPLPSDMLTVLYLSFNLYLICWLYHIWHSTSIWYADCIISVIPLPEVEWQI
jgi:hypothetical protein